MVIFLLILMILLGVAIILHAIGAVKDNGNMEHVVSILIVSFGIVALGCVAAVISDTPTAMDVYEGKTEMKYYITIRGNDTIVDSTLVLKEDK